jgi:bacteriocin biosynthesis cyclodehydratase domain-containing protein
LSDHPVSGPGSRTMPAPFARWAPLVDGVVMGAGSHCTVYRGRTAARVRDCLVNGEVVADGAVATVVASMLRRGYLWDATVRATSYEALLSMVLGADPGRLRADAEGIHRIDSVGVRGGGPIVEGLFNLLRMELATGGVKVEAGTEAGRLGPTCLVVYVIDAKTHGELAAINEEMWTTGTPWLALVATAGEPLLVGPLIIPPETACFDCYTSRRLASSQNPISYVALSQAARRDIPAGAWLTHMIVGLAASVVLGWLLAADPWLPSALFELSPERGPQLRRHEVLPVPDCRTCRGSWRSSPALAWPRFDMGAGDDNG